MSALIQPRPGSREPGLHTAQSGGDMLTCDRCGPSVRAAVTYRRGTSVFAWCAHHGAQYHAALTRAGYARQTLEAMAASG